MVVYIGAKSRSKIGLLFSKVEKLELFLLLINITCVFCRRVRKLNVVGRIPAELQNLTFLQDLYGSMTCNVNIDNEVC